MPLRKSPIAPLVASALLLCVACSSDDRPSSGGSDAAASSDAAGDVAVPVDAAETGTADDASADGADARDGAADDDASPGDADDGGLADAAPDATSDSSGGLADSGLDGGDVAADTADAAADTTDVAPDTGPPVTDPFDPQSCPGSQWSASAAIARLGSNSDEVLDAQTVMERHRTCNSSGCGPWGQPTKTDIRYLTYSGGVTTRYTTLRANTSLVLYEEAGKPKLSVRHDTHLNHYPNKHEEGIVFGFPPMVEPYPRLRAWNTSPQRPSDYRDLENYLGRDAKLHATANCARFTAVLPGRNQDVETQYVAVYRY